MRPYLLERTWLDLDHVLAAEYQQFGNDTQHLLVHLTMAFRDKPLSVDWVSPEDYDKLLAAWKGAAQPAPGVAVPDGWLCFYTKGFYDLMEALERADRKGYLQDAMADEWNVFEYLSVEQATEMFGLAASPQPPTQEQA